VSPILAIHIGGGTLGLVSGAAALSFRKGSGWHALAGKVFVASLLTMAAGAICLAIQNHEPPNIRVGGTTRIARHLWRMCFGLFIATGSFFLGPANRPLRFLSAIGLRQHFFKTVLREEVLLFLAVLPLLFMIFWLVRVRFANAFKKMPEPHEGNVYSFS